MVRSGTWIVICLAATAAIAGSAASPPAPSAPQPTAMLPMPGVSESPSLDDLHARYLDVFVRSPGFGMMRISPMRQLMNDSGVRIDGAVLRVADVGLIGIAKHDPPVFYASGFDGISHSGDRRDVQSHGVPRDLSEWEQQALGRLAKGATVVDARRDDGLLCAIGPIRAKSECLACHRNHREGDMLGAMVYTLRSADGVESGTSGRGC